MRAAAANTATASVRPKAWKTSASLPDAVRPTASLRCPALTARSRTPTRDAIHRLPCTEYISRTSANARSISKPDSSRLPHRRQIAMRSSLPIRPIIGGLPRS